MSRRTVYILVIAVALLLGMASGVLWANGTGNLNINARDLAQARTRWDNNSVGEYEVTLQYACYCPLKQGTWTLRVRDGQVEPAYTRHNDQPVTAGPGTDQAALQTFTVERQFATVEQFLNKRDSAFTYTVRFDPVLGYPATIEMQPQAGQIIEDSGWSMTVTRLTPLQAKNEP